MPRNCRTIQNIDKRKISQREFLRFGDILLQLYGQNNYKSFQNNIRNGSRLPGLVTFRLRRPKTSLNNSWMPAFAGMTYVNTIMRPLIICLHVPDIFVRRPCRKNINVIFLSPGAARILAGPKDRRINFVRNISRIHYNCRRGMPCRFRSI